MLAHELTHAVQVRSGPVDGTDAGGGVKVSDPSDRFEREAVANADRVMSAPAPAVAAPAGVQRVASDAPMVQREEAPEEEEHGANLCSARRRGIRRRVRVVGMSEPARERLIGDALSEARRKTQRPQPRPGPTGMLGLQRLAGNAAVNALMAAKTKAPGEEATGKIDSALTEMGGSDPVIATVEAGLKAAEAAGVPVQLEAPKPPASALAVTTTGFGPEAVAPPWPARPPKPVAPGNALGKASAKAGGAAHGGASRGGGAAGPAAASPGAVASTGATALSSDQLNQPPVPPSHIAPEHDPAFQQVAGGVKRVAADKRAHPPAASQAQQAQGAARTR